MADEEKDGTSSRGADWEVVALTASTYAAAPRPDADPSDAFKDKESQQEHESSNTMLMSAHFVFPPHEHENLPIEMDSAEIHDQTEIHGVFPAEEENDYLYEFKGDELSFDNMESKEGETHSFFDAETDSRQMMPLDDENDISETYDSSNKFDDIPPDISKRTSDGNGGSGLPNEASWKRHAISLYKQAKETNTFWSIFIAATLMGLVVIGKQWQREKLQLQQLKWQFSNTNERMSRLLGSVNRFKDAFVGSHQHSSLIRGGAASASI